MKNTKNNQEKILTEIHNLKREVRELKTIITMLLDMIADTETIDNIIQTTQQQKLRDFMYS